MTQAESGVAAGNLLGAPRAEIDKLLDDAFLETGDYKALTQSTDFNFVVGRRGTGKSALFVKLQQHFATRPGVFLRAETPPEYETLQLQHTLSQLTDDYVRARAISRVAWRLHLLCITLEELEKHYRISKSKAHEFFTAYRRQNPQLFTITGASRVDIAIKSISGTDQSVTLIPGIIAQLFQIEQLQQAVRLALQDVKNLSVILYDGLDEGWLPSSIPTAVLGGLAVAISDLADSKTGIHCVAFVRDNMFRALAHFDGDFSRNVEGNALRLRWFSDGLLTLVARRLRVALDLQIVERDVKVWNRFARRELQERKGFESCLRHTLYRPRDILMLLNYAFRIANDAERMDIVGTDVETSASMISNDRLTDLRKEYETVLPGLGLFIHVFRNGAATSTIGQMAIALQESIAKADYGERGSSDLALFASGLEAATALYSVGFFGIQTGQEGRYRFCHDGSLVGIDPSEQSVSTVIHPCYWSALNLSSATELEEVALQIDDDLYRKGAEREIRDLRLKMLGQIVEELPRLSMGPEGVPDFEDWVLRTLKMLFGEDLSHFELLPDPEFREKHVIVANNTSHGGFWKKIADRQGGRRVLFDVINGKEPKEENLRTMLAFSSEEFGRFAVVITRSENEGLSHSERHLLSEFHRQQEQIAFIVPGVFLARCVSKLRTADKYDYTQKQLAKRMDTFVKNYLKLKQQRSYQSKQGA